MDFTSHLLAISVFLALLILYNQVRRKKNGESQNKKRIIPPEPSSVLPIIGHLHLLNSHKPLARTLAAMSDQYGHIFAVRFGSIRAVVVNNAEAVKECFTTNDKVFAARPKSRLGEYLGYKNAAFAFASYNPFYREIRKIAVTQLLSPQRLKSLWHIQIEEVNILIKDLYHNNGRTKVDISELFEKLTLNVITRMIAGKRCFGMGNDVESLEGKRIGKLMKEFMLILGSPMISDMIPILRCVDSLFGSLKTLKRISRELDSVMEEWIEEHKLKMVKSDSEKDFMDIMLCAIDQDDVKYGYSRETIIKATAMTLIIAGADTTYITSTWILSNLLNHRHARELAVQEIDLKIGKKRWVDQSDITNLVYLQNVIKETLRLYPPAPLAVPHEATQDCFISGYHIAKGTQLLVNLWKLHRDPNIWSNPDEFIPERFAADKARIDISRHCFEFIPFGSGRRSCPGITFAMQLIPLTIARLLQGFEIKTSMNLDVDMSEGLGVTLPKATPLEIEVTPRLCPQLYD